MCQLDVYLHSKTIFGREKLSYEHLGGKQQKLVHLKT